MVVSISVSLKFSVLILRYCSIGECFLVDGTDEKRLQM